MKDLVNADGRLVRIRINCHHVYAYLKDHRPHTEIALALEIYPEEVLALIHYIVEHEEEVEANWQAFEAMAAKGNPPEIEAKLVETRARMKAWLEDRKRQRAEEQAGDPLLIDVGTGRLLVS
jgi:hypothetical protein